MIIGPGVHLGAYEILSLIGAGGMGEVYRARDTRLGRTVAIKVLAANASADEAARYRLFREAKAISSLDHPNICALYDVGHEHGIDYLVMQYLEGETLAARLRRGPLPFDEAVRCAAEIATALEAAHARGIVHRDLKPANVMLTSAGAKLLDFGLARRRARGDAATTTDAHSDQATQTVLTGPGTVLGTLPYMAPEQLEGRPADTRSDIFSFGAVLYEMLTGRRPFVADAAAGVMTKIISVTPPPPSRVNPIVPRAFDAIVARCLAKSPGERWQTATELLRALTVSDAHGVPRRMPPWAYASTAAMLLGIAGLLVVGMPVLREGSLRGSAVAGEANATVLAVLPFEVESPDPAERAFWSGLSQALAVKLAQLPGANHLHVVSGVDPAVRAVKTVAEARQELGATRVLRGVVSPLSDRHELQLALIDTRSGEVEGTVRAATHRQDPAATHDGVLDAVLSLLELPIPAQERARLAAPRATAGAYDFYLQGLGYMQNYDRPEAVDTAIAVFKHALTLDADHAPTHAGLGRAYWRKYVSTRDVTWVDTARRACERALVLDDAEASPHLCLATVEMGMGRYEKSVQEYLHALEREPTSEQAYVGLADAYRRLNAPAKAEETYLRAIALRPGYWGAHSALGTFYYASGRYDEAEAAFRRVIALSPDSWRAHSNLGALHYVRGRTREAIAAYETSLALRPNAAAASNLGALYFYDVRDYRRAAAAFRRALDIQDTEYVLWGNYAWALRWAGDAPAAAAAFDRAVELAERRREVNPRDVATTLSLAEYHSARGRTAAARPLLDEVLAAAPDEPRLLYRIGVLHETAFSDRERAMDWLGRALNRGYPMKDLERDPALDGFRRDGGVERLRRTTTPPDNGGR